MATAVAAPGGILVLLSFGGVAFESRMLSTKESVPPGDRIAAILVGAALLALATVVELHRFSAVLWVALAIDAAAALGYSSFLYLTRPRNALPSGNDV
jgi:hypothetical protein